MVDAVTTVPSPGPAIRSAASMTLNRAVLVYLGFAGYGTED